VHEPDIQVRPEDELPVVIDDYDFACIGFGRQLTDSGVVRNVALYSKAIILESLIRDSLNFISAHTGEVSGSAVAAATEAAHEEYDALLKKWEGPGMPVFVDDTEVEDDGQVDDGAEEPLEG
jgi:hypothetical protein